MNWYKACWIFQVPAVPPKAVVHVRSKPTWAIQGHNVQVGSGTLTDPIYYNILSQLGRFT
jgi:hypothetical protein